MVLILYIYTFYLEICTERVVGMLDISFIAFFILECNDSSLLALVQLADCCHLIITEVKVKHIEVLRDAGQLGRLWDQAGPSLNLKGNTNISID